jgi:hypothetical protein
VSQLRKLRRHARPPVAIDLETSSLRPGGKPDSSLVGRALSLTRRMPGGLSAESVARHGNLSVEQAQALIETYQAYRIFDEVDKPRRIAVEPERKL